MATKTTRRTSRKPTTARLHKKLDGSLANLTRAELIRRLEALDLEYLFKHALVQDSAYSSLMKHERKRLHHMVAETLVQAYPNALDEIAARVAQHYAQAGEPAQTANYAERAGDAAAALFAYPEARLQYAEALRALEFLPLGADTARRRIDLWTKYVGVALRLEGPERALENLARAQELFAHLPAPETIQDRARRARVAFWQGDANLHKSQPREAIRYMQQVLELVAQGVDDESLAAIPANVMGRALAVQGQFPKAQPLLERAVPALAQTSNWTEWVLAKGFLALTLAMRGDIQAALAQTDGALARAQELGTQIGVEDSYGLAALAHMQAGEYARAFEAARASVDHAAQMGDHLVIYIATNTRGWAELRLGWLDTARATFAEARRVAAETGGSLVFADWFGAAEAELELEAGTAQDAFEQAQSALEFASRVGGLYAQGVSHRVCGQALVKLGQFDTAFEHFQNALQLFESGDAHLEAARTHVIWGQILQQHGDGSAARENFEHALVQYQASLLEHEADRVRTMLNQL